MTATVEGVTWGPWSVRSGPVEDADQADVEATAIESLGQPPDQVEAAADVEQLELDLPEGVTP